MQSLSLSSAQPLLFSLCNKPFPSLQTPTLHQKSHLFHHHSTRIPFHPFGFSVKDQKMLRPRRRFGAACYSAPLTPRNLQWICTVSSAILMFSKGTAVQKSFLVPFFALQAPASIITWIKGEYGTWTAFLVLLVRLFFFIPADLELPLVALLLGIVAPYQAVGLSFVLQRDTRRQYCLPSDCRLFGLPAFLASRQLADSI
ncbi:cold-regulated 413 inner membrane protein 1, chloroplastic-like isoform X2 [Malania oleifera]|uniref:cold-regulated 413 inner membrane protein 1, chloroplastic-like isoform X2 n=1 Tax=Malania oleifera TaxID=397392 RepID=UPI0025ADDA88|nr:cold-regulated 413 inner membrane protein 1, chloroplastic-like isoform X2 [Malania oleifera]